MWTLSSIVVFDGPVNFLLFKYIIWCNQVYIGDFMFHRLRAGNVIFNYKYYNNTMQKTEGSPSLPPSHDCNM